MCAKRSRRNHRAKKWGTLITNFLNHLTVAVMKCLADVVHAHMWQNLHNFTNKDIPIRLIQCPAQNDSIGVLCSDLFCEVIGGVLVLLLSLIKFDIFA